MQLLRALSCCIVVSIASTTHADPATVEVLATPIGRLLVDIHVATLEPAAKAEGVKRATAVLDAARSSGDAREALGTLRAWTDANLPEDSASIDEARVRLDSFLTAPRVITVGELQAVHDFLTSKTISLPWHELKDSDTCLARALPKAKPDGPVDNTALLLMGAELNYVAVVLDELAARHCFDLASLGVKDGE